MFVNYVLLKICQHSVQYKKVISNNQTYEQQLHYFVRIPKFRYQYSVLWNIFFYFIFFFFQKKKKKKKVMVRVTQKLWALNLQV